MKIQSFQGVIYYKQKIVNLDTKVSLEAFVYWYCDVLILFKQLQVEGTPSPAEKKLQGQGK